MRITLVKIAEHACAYMSGKTASEQIAVSPFMDSSLYQSLMDQGFRRSGNIFYRPDCNGCRDCIPIRIPIADFRPSRSQRRVLSRNSDVQVEIGPPILDQERFLLYELYQKIKHGKEDKGGAEGYEAAFVNSPVQTIEMSYRVEGVLMGVGIIDVTPLCLSSVYFYFHPDFAKRSPGVFSALCEIEECRRRGLSWWYAGFWLRDCSKMRYKSDFRPFELLRERSTWEPAG